MGRISSLGINQLLAAAQPPITQWRHATTGLERHHALEFSAVLYSAVASVDGLNRKPEVLFFLSAQRWEQQAIWRVLHQKMVISWRE